MLDKPTRDLFLTELASRQDERLSLQECFGDAPLSTLLDRVLSLAIHDNGYWSFDLLLPDTHGGYLLYSSCEGLMGLRHVEGRAEAIDLWQAWQGIDGPMFEFGHM